jgi:hypothetical protein
MSESLHTEDVDPQCECRGCLADPPDHQWHLALLNEWQLEQSEATDVPGPEDGPTAEYWQARMHAGYHDSERELLYGHED